MRPKTLSVPVPVPVPVPLLVLVLSLATVRVNGVDRVRLVSGIIVFVLTCRGVQVLVDLLEVLVLLELLLKGVIVLRYVPAGSSLPVLVDVDMDQRSEVELGSIRGSAARVEAATREMMTCTTGEPRTNKH
jgi:hypothetical protein